jgi:hypothetical protein
VGSLERRAGALPVHKHLCLQRALSSRLLVFEATLSSITTGVCQEGISLFPVGEISCLQTLVTYG